MSHLRVSCWIWEAAQITYRIPSVHWFIHIHSSSLCYCALAVGECSITMCMMRKWIRQISECDFEGGFNQMSNPEMHTSNFYNGRENGWCPPSGRFANLWKRSSNLFFFSGSNEALYCLVQNEGALVSIIPKHALCWNTVLRTAMHMSGRLFLLQKKNYWCVFYW